MLNARSRQFNRTPKRNRVLSPKATKSRIISFHDESSSYNTQNDLHKLNHSKVTRPPVKNKADSNSQTQISPHALSDGREQLSVQREIEHEVIRQSVDTTIKDLQDTLTKATKHHDMMENARNRGIGTKDSSSLLTPTKTSKRNTSKAANAARRKPDNVSSRQENIRKSLIRKQNIDSSPHRNINGEISNNNSILKSKSRTHRPKGHVKFDENTTISHNSPLQRNVNKPLHRFSDEAQENMSESNTDEKYSDSIETFDPTDPVIIVTPISKEEQIKEGARKREERISRTLKRKDEIDRERLKKLHLNSGMMRQIRLKKKTVEEKNKYDMLRRWMTYIALGNRLQQALDVVDRFRAYKRRIKLEDDSARIITRQMRLYRFRMYRKRVKAAICVLGTVFVMKVRLWKNSRRRVASDIVRSFLISLDDENKKTGGCLALIVKGKKWRAYRMKIVTLQRLWRAKLRIIYAQTLLIDRQWQREQNRRTNIEVERLYKLGEAEATAENENIDNINRTRKLIKLRPLPKKRWDTRSQIRDMILKGTDILSVGNIVPQEIRHGIIKEMLKHMRRKHVDQMVLYRTYFKRFKEEQNARQRRRALLVGFSGNYVAKALTSTPGKARQDSPFPPKSAPTKPHFSVILGTNTIDMLLRLGAEHVEKIRKYWNPKFMHMLPIQSFHGKEAAEIHFSEIYTIDNSPFTND